ncbi:MAG: putative toxin-antitoxin system toxin component, PIN family [Planctomycetes bacterium]|nr:putative toxin-antitoxin system toxin component, PIN family [Planctomycetota bacterium]
MRKVQIVIDTDVFISALRSRKGASYKLLTLLGSDKYEINVSVALVLEYEDVAKRFVGEIALTESDINDIIDYVCLVANKKKVFYLWRPVLKDPNDDMVLELAVAANCEFIITFNKKDFRQQDLKPFGLKALAPKEFLQKIGELS